MKAAKKLVLDANILISAVLGRRVSQLLNDFEDSVSFFSPDLCFEEVRRNLVSLSAKRGFDARVLLTTFEQTCLIVQGIDARLYEAHEAAAKERIAARDVSDWPLVATALLLNCPIWTEDRDFFGSGIATWTTATVEHYLKAVV